MEKNTKAMVLHLGLLVFLTAVLVPLLYFDTKPAEYLIQNGILKISGSYGEEIKLSDIVGITIKEQIPKIQFRSNGYVSRNVKKGYFKLKDIGQAKLFIGSEKPPFIFINVKSGLRILNTNEPEGTEKLYEKLMEAWKQNTY